MDIFALFQCLQPHGTATLCRQCSRMALAMLVRTGRVTMLGIARWAGNGGSDRTVQRFFAQALPWATLFWAFFRQHGHGPEEGDLVAGDAVIVTTAGKSPHGLDRFFASLSGKPVPGLAFFTLSLGRVQPRRSFPLRVEPVVRSDAEQAASKAQAAAKKPKAPSAKRRPGRPKGSRNTKKTAVTLTPDRLRINAMREALLHLMARGVPWTSLRLDGHFGTPNALQRARQGPLHLIAKRRGDAARSFPSPGPYAGWGPQRTEGRQVDDDNRPVQDLPETTVEGHLQTRFYPRPLLHKAFAQPLPVVIIATTHRHTQARAHVLLGRSDLERAEAPLVDDYGRRFHLEFPCRDAKPYWGLEDFINITPTGVTHAAHLSLFMVHVAYRLRLDGRQRAPDSSVLDLQADCRGYKDVEETLNMLPEKPEPVFFATILKQVAGLGRMHAAQPSFSFS